jgi:hypothetical protein
MNPHSTLTRRFANGLLNIASRLLPGSKAEWARAMLSEMHYLASDRRAVSWAAGCCIASIKERLIAMIIGNLRVSPWVFCLEMMLCFVPLGVGWVDSLVGGSGIFWLNGQVIHRYLIGNHGDELVLAMMICGPILGFLAPIGLVAAYRLIALGRPIRSRWLGSALIVGPLLYGVLTLAFRFAIGGSAVFGASAMGAFDVWSGVLLLSLLPALGAWHSFLFGTPRSD